MPENPKVVGLSDGAFRLYIETICYSSRARTDGVIRAGAIRRLGSAESVEELHRAGLLDQVGGDWEVHDYLQHQRSSGEIAQIRELRSESGKLGAHARWHLARREYDPKCVHCNPEAAVEPDG